MNAKTIIEKMSKESRSKAEAKAAEAGITLEAHVDRMLSVELNDQDLDGVSGGVGAKDSGYLSDTDIDAGDLHIHHHGDKIQ